MTLSTDRIALQRAAAKLGSKRAAGKRLPPLLAFTDPHRSGDLFALAARLPRGAALVYRAFGAQDRLEVAQGLRRITWRRGALLIVGADADLARRVHADGLHLPERMAGALPFLRDFRLTTVAAHSPRAVARALALGADAVVISPVFESNSPSAGRPLGALRTARIVRDTKGAVYGLGGIDGRNAARAAATGLAGLAAVEAFRT